MRNAVCLAPLHCDGYSVDHLLDDEAVLRVRHCSVSDRIFEVSDNYFVVMKCSLCS